MSNCKFCGESFSGTVKKCRACGEPQGWRVYFWGNILKYIPLLSTISIVTTIISLGLAIYQMRGKEKAQTKLNVTEKAADQAIRSISEKISSTSRNEVIKNLRLPANTTLEQLEQKANASPGNVDLQKKVFLYRWLKKPDGE